MEEQTVELTQIGAERTKNVLILMSDTGGGHRASAEAIWDAFKLEFGDEYTGNRAIAEIQVAHYIFPAFDQKSLLFYKGRAAKGIKLDWMMHEFRVPSLTESKRVSRSIGDVCMKHARFNKDPIAVKFRLPEPMKQAGLSVLQFLPSLVKSAQDLARPHISKYHVGAVGLGSDGRIFFGANLEFPGLPLHHSVHAEQFLVTNAAVNGDPQLKYTVVSSAPCGHCRQFLQELRGDNELVFRPR